MSVAPEISINGVTYSTTSTTETATFTTSATAPEAVDGKYYAVYPSTIAFNTSTKTITLPATQTYDANGISNVPMVAVSENTELQFKNICTVLAIKVASGTVKKIKVMADGKALSGDFTLDPSSYSITATTGSNTVVLDCGGTAVTAENTTFYIAIPPQEYSSLQIYLSADGTTYKEAMATKVAAGLGTLERNNIFPITYAKNAVQLWENGPYFATMNVGETAVGGKTAKYAWGATSADGAANANTVTKNANAYDLEYDTAYKIWGSAWRMPTQGEFEAMSSNCNLGYSSGGTFTFTGKNGYNSAKVSFPGEYVDICVTAQYWTSSVDNSGNVYYGDFFANKGDTSFKYNGGSRPLDGNYNDLKYFVRAVLATPAAAPVPDPNLLKGVFSVSATKKVQFTKGNLYWTGSAYLFEADQTTYPKSWEANHIGHFYWSKTATVAYDEIYTDGSRGTTDKLFCGEDNKLTVSGTSDLYVLSAEEWHYLTGIYSDDLYDDNVHRSDANRFANARVNGVVGLLIFPDGYNGTTSGTGIAEVNKDVVANMADYPSASIDPTTWSEMEAAGVVFLPAAGCRSAQQINNCGKNGYYWSSTLNDEDNAYMLFDSYGTLTCPSNQDRERGCSIRLVKTVE